MWKPLCLNTSASHRPGLGCCHAGRGSERVVPILLGLASVAPPESARCPSSRATNMPQGCCCMSRSSPDLYTAVLRRRCRCAPPRAVVARRRHARACQRFQEVRRRSALHARFCAARRQSACWPWLSLVRSTVRPQSVAPLRRPCAAACISMRTAPEGAIGEVDPRSQLGRRTSRARARIARGRYQRSRSRCIPSTHSAAEQVGTRGHQFPHTVLGEEVHHHEDVLRADRPDPWVRQGMAWGLARSPWLPERASTHTST